MTDKIKQWCADVSYSGDDNLFITRLRSKGLNDKQIEGVIDALDSTCKECFDGDSKCQCWNDI